MKKITLTLISVFLINFNLTSLSETIVSSKTYSFMLNSLLSHTVPEISVTDINDPENYIYLDSREKNEFDVSHILNAKWIGYEDFNPKRVEEIPIESNIIVYCSVGYRSEKISEKLIKLGYKNVSNLYGGIFEWKNQGKPIYEKINNEYKKTNKVHAFDKVWGIWLNKGEKVFK